MAYDTVIHNALVITVNPQFEIFSPGRVCIQEGLLKRVEPEMADDPLPSAKEHIDAKGAIVMPGLVNNHTHLAMTLFRGLADDLPLMEWPNQHIFPAEKAHITPDSVFSGTLLACAEMILAGITTCCDGYFHAQHVAKAIEISGLRAVLGQGVIDFPAPGVPDPAMNIKTAAGFIEKWQNRCHRIDPSVFCHSTYTCSDDVLKRAKKIAAGKDVLFQIHISETQNEFNQTKQHHGVTPIEHLHQLDILDCRTLLVHAVWLDPLDIAIISKSKASVSHNPESNMKLASGIAPVPEMIERGIIVGLGTDGCASNNTLDLMQAMDITAKLHKMHTLDPTVINARCALEMATINSARSIGLGERVGSLEPGKAADLIMVSTDSPHMTPLYHPVSQIVYAAGADDVTATMVAGNFLMRDRRLTTIDLNAALEAVRRIGKSIAPSLLPKNT